MTVCNYDFVHQVAKDLSRFFPVPIIVDTELQATDCQWNHDGSVLAICGMRTNGTEKENNVVLFYSPLGVVSFFNS